MLDVNMSPDFKVTIYMKLLCVTSWLQHRHVCTCANILAFTLVLVRSLSWDIMPRHLIIGFRHLEMTYWFYFQGLMYHFICFGNQDRWRWDHCIRNQLPTVGMSHSKRMQIPCL
jgi:hypothetical protein